MTAKSTLYCFAATSVASVSLIMAINANAQWPPQPPPPPPFVPGYPPPPPPPPFVPVYVNPGQTPVQMDPGQIPAGPVTGGGPDDLGGGRTSPPVTGGGPEDLGGGQPSAPVTGGGPQVSVPNPYGGYYVIPSPHCGCGG